MFGITHNNVIKYTKDNLPNTYIINNRKIIFHNANKFCAPIAVFFCMMAVSCVMTEIVYVTSPMATMLWLYIRKFMEEIKNAENS